MQTKKYIKLTEQQVRAVASMINENAETNNINAAKQFLKQNGHAEDYQTVINNLRHDIPNVRLGKYKFLQAICRMYITRQLKNEAVINQINNTLKYLASDSHINQYDRDLNTMSATSIIDRFKGTISQDNERDRENLYRQTFNNNGQYNIVRIDSFEQAQQYGTYTTWCITQERDMYDNYTSRGINQFYFCLKNGFERIPKREGENSPLDEYGLSMIAVSVNPDGSMHTCTVRWNHDMGGNDSIMDTMQLSQVIGMNFYEVFKPNATWNNKMASLEKCLSEYGPTTSRGETYKLVEYLKDEGIIDDYRVLDDKYKADWYCICLCGKCNILADGNRFVINKWVDGISSGIVNGYVKVVIDEYVNIADINTGNVCFKQKFLEMSAPNENGICVACEQDDNGNYLNNWYDCKTGNPLSTGFSCRIQNFNRNGFAIVGDYGEMNIVNSQGKLIMDRWVNNIDTSGYNGGFFIVSTNNGENYVNGNGQFLLQNDVEYCVPFSDGYGVITDRDGYPNVVDQKGRRMFANSEYIDIKPFYNGYSLVQRNGDRKFNVVSAKTMKPVSPIWLDDYYKPDKSNWKEYFRVIDTQYGSGFGGVVAGQDVFVDFNGNIYTYNGGQLTAMPYTPVRRAPNQMQDYKRAYAKYTPHEEE